MVVPVTCCGRSGEWCLCASQARCSCGAQSALNCNCERANAENSPSGARCSCRKSLYLPCSFRIINELTRSLSILYSEGARRQGQCNCDRADTENVVSGNTCECGKRRAGNAQAGHYACRPRFSQVSPLDACTCEKASDGGSFPEEVDFTTKK